MEKTKKSIYNLKALLKALDKDLDKSLNGFKIPAQRARVLSVLIEKEFKNFRKASAVELKIGSKEFRKISTDELGRN